MTEKRFTESIYGITDNQTNIQYGWREADLGIMKLCELLNNLNQEISDLKKWLSTVPQLENRISKLNDENEQLKKENRSLIIELDAHKHIQHTKYEQIKKENEQLESDLQMSREKALYWRNKAENLFGDMRTNVELTRENRQLKNELKELKKAVK